MNLAEIRISGNPKLTEDQLTKLNELLNTDADSCLKFKTKNDFEVTPYMEGYIKGETEANQALADREFLACRSLALKEIKSTWNTYIVDIGVMLSEFPNVSFEVKKAIKIKNNSLGYNLASALNRIEDVQDRADKTLSNLSQFNEKVNVHVGNALLLTINETLVESDCCTEYLDGMLSKGWRILAVCVQPDQRRPDYVLGRFNPNKNE